MTSPYKVAIFDIDNTLTESRAPISKNLARLLSKLIDEMPVAIISGGSRQDFEKQVISHLNFKRKENLLVLPTEGAELQVFKSGSWHTVYSYPISDHNRRIIIERLAKIARAKPTQIGQYIEDRGGVIALHGIDKDSSLEEKYAWDPTHERRRAIIKHLEPHLKGISMKIAGSTTINFTENGVDKAFGIHKLLTYLKIAPHNAVFVGDSFDEGGNDAPALTTGVDIRKTRNPKSTESIVLELL